MKTAAHRILETLKDILADFHVDVEAAIGRMRPLYVDDVVFQDPLQKLAGWEAFADMNRRLQARARTLRFHVGDLVGDGDQAFLSWRLDIALKRVPGMIRMEGTTHLKLRDQKIAYHRDYWDLLGTVMAALPVAPVYRRLVARLG